MIEFANLLLIKKKKKKKKKKKPIIVSYKQILNNLLTENYNSRNI